MLTALCEYQWYCNHEDLTEGHFQRYILDVVETRPSKQKVTATDLKKALKHVTMKAKGDVNHRVMENVYDSITNHYLWQPLEETETRKVFVRAVTEIMPLELADQVRENYEVAQCDRTWMQRKELECPGTCKLKSEVKLTKDENYVCLGCAIHSQTLSCLDMQEGFPGLGLRWNDACLCATCTRH
ncbi:hypothetical protein AeRB84_007501 [Aphanomyces euteiches]|nr:hypothetical protein AeRB84_007501 [Aphanomyces euteiches]